MMSGVPQGYHLAPLLFIWYINDIHYVIKSLNFLIYADDIKIFNQIQTPTDAEDLQNDLQAIYLWSITNGLKLNIDKCQTMSFTRSKEPFYYDYLLDNHILNKLDCVKDLGVWMDSRLDFKTHIHKICAKASRSLGFLKLSTRSFRNATTIISLYKSIVIPHSLYCSPIWSQFLKINQSKIQTINHSFLRYLAFKSNFPLHRFDHNYNPITFKYRIPSITSLHNYND